MSTETEKLERQNIVLLSQVQWLTGVNDKLRVMIKNAADVLEEYTKSVGEIHQQLQVTQQIYARLHKDLTEAFNEQNSQNEPGA